jgi:hypothetical protein
MSATGMNGTMVAGQARLLVDDWLQLHFLSNLFQKQPISAL